MRRRPQHTPPEDEERPEIFVLGGPNGSGKSTVAGHLLPRDLGVANFVNADTIADELSPGAPEASSIEAGRVMLRRIRELRTRRARFAFESTLASKTFAPFLRAAKTDGYHVHVLYVSLSHPDVAVQRVRLRVRRGGHGIPDAIIRRRYSRSLSNLFELYRPLADSWIVCDNTGYELVDVAHRREGAEPFIVDEARWKRLIRQASDHAD